MNTTAKNLRERMKSLTSKSAPVEGVSLSFSEVPEFTVRLSLNGDWENIELMRWVVDRFVKTVFEDDDFGDSVAMVSAELLENAIKYSPQEEGVQCAIGFELMSDRQKVAVTVSNPVGSDRASARALVDRIELLRQAEDVREAYQERIIAVFDGKVTHGGLGLVRIAYEGNCDLSCGIEDDHVQVTARFRRVGAYRHSNKETANVR